MNCESIVKSYLEANGFDGLVNLEGDTCGCEKDDLMCGGMCGGMTADCKPAYRHAKDTCQCYTRTGKTLDFEDGDWLMATFKCPNAEVSNV